MLTCKEEHILRVKYHFLPKQQVTFCKTNDSGEKALQIMNETGFRAIPVLAENEKEFTGIIYKVDLLEKKCNSRLEDVRQKMYWKVQIRLFLKRILFLELFTLFVVSRF